MKIMQRFQLLALIVFSQINLAGTDQSALGIWETHATSDGYLHITIKPCGEALCGTITRAYQNDGTAGDDYEHIGKNMVWDMVQTSENRWAGGKIWDPTNNKTYKSKMSVNGDSLSVSGCVFVFCRSQVWTRVGPQ